MVDVIENEDIASRLPSFVAPYAAPEEEVVEELLKSAALTGDMRQQVAERAQTLIEAIRKRSSSLGGVEDFLKAYSLSTKEGLAIMVLAEALLRVPDAATADHLIEDKLAAAEFGAARRGDEPWLIAASAWALGVTRRIIHPGETTEGVFAGIVKRLGKAPVRAAIRQAMRLMGHQFVLGETIEAALGRARGAIAKGYRYSYDMLGEGARTTADADHYFESYTAAIAAIGKSAGSESLPARPGISVKLSALHPRYEAAKEEVVLRELYPRLLELARAARAHDLNFTIDAEEADRLELSLALIARVAADPSLKGWEGYGFAIQAYQKRAIAVIDWAFDLATTLDRRFMLRLVKGAYWDGEIKRAQERGLADYPVFTRKAGTDLSYRACAKRLLNARPRLYPQFATHNALTVAEVFALAGRDRGFEFQRLHGMGDSLYAQVTEEEGQPCRIYAPVGGHRDLLAYLVRRLLENGANSSFVSSVNDPDVPVAALIRPAEEALREGLRHPRIPLPGALYGGRKNPAGVEFGSRVARTALVRHVRTFQGGMEAAPILSGKEMEAGPPRALLSPLDGRTRVGTVREAHPSMAGEAIAVCARGFERFSKTGAEARAQILEKAADLLEARRDDFIALLALEAGKTLVDGVAEVREAVDFCRYYALEARRLFSSDLFLTGPTGEENRLRLRGRGVFAAISPWNFPLAIFLGQVSAALAAGNTVVAKPAEETPLVAHAAVRLLLEAGLPPDALALLPGDGAVGAALTEDPRLAGVVFTGSTSTAFAINRALAARHAPIVPLIAETGGINAMIADATALAEQVTDDVMASAFRSAGQRCSALRLLFLQEDIADKMLSMIIGAAETLALGDPRDPATDVGPVINEDAQARLMAAVAAIKEKGGRVLYAGKAPGGTLSAGTYVPPHVVELSSARLLTEEVFGPVLHVVRYRADRIDEVLRDIAATGFGLTLGIHSRIDTFIETITRRLPIGNIYVNRNMIGAVVGVQPFGGAGLSGTGPKAGGPHYLSRFALEQVISINTAAAGGNATLIAMSGDDTPSL